MCQLVVVKTNASIKVGAARRTLQQGTVLCVSDPLVAGREKLFRPLEVQHYCGETDRSVEQTTAAPGEKRDLRPSTGRRARKSNPESDDDSD